MAGWNELSLREDPVGGEVRETVRELTPPFPQGRRRVVLLIHGYNNTKDAARAAYETFTDDLAALGPGAGALLADVGKLYWPGDVALGPLSFLSYPTELEPAKKTAENLATYLRTLAGPAGTPVELYFVCHSLGNRVLLELLDRLAEAPAPLGHVAAVVCMAAAVPVELVDAGGALLRGARLPDKTLVLYSRDDTVLHWAFPLGETAAGDGFLPTAVGRFGEPSGLWTERDELAGDDHGDYWGDPRAAIRLARVLGAAVPQALEAAAIARRTLPRATAIASREIPARELQS